MRPWSGRGHIEVAMLCFDRQTTKTYCLSEQEELTASQEQQLKHAKHWDNCTFSLASGSFFSINRESLRGKLHTSQGSVHWSFRLFRQDMALKPLPTVYRPLAWPRYRVQVRDGFLKYLGKIQLGELDWAGDFQGSVHHYDGDGYPTEYAAAQCNRFAEDAQAFFYGFSSRLSVSGKQTPYLSMASLKVNGEWYNFNAVSRCFRHQLEALDNYRWRVSYVNRDYQLDVEVNGGNPRLVPWAGWHAGLPTGGRALVKATPFAEGRLTLRHKLTQDVVAELTSRVMELKTRLPENLAEGYGFWVAP